MKAAFAGFSSLCGCLIQSGVQYAYKTWFNCMLYTCRYINSSFHEDIYCQIFLNQFCKCCTAYGDSYSVFNLFLIYYYLNIMQFNCTFSIPQRDTVSVVSLTWLTDMMLNVTTCLGSVGDTRHTGEWCVAALSRAHLSTSILPDTPSWTPM